MEKGYEGYFNDLEDHCIQCLGKNKEIIRLKAEVTRLKAESWDNREDRGKPYKYINGK